MRGLVHAIVQLAPFAPAVGIVVADDVAQNAELGGGRLRLGGNLVAAGSDRARGILAVEDADQFAQNLHAVFAELVANFVTAAPQRDGRMIAVPADEIRDIAFMPLVVVSGIAVAADLAFTGFPLIEGFIHYQKAHAVAEIQKLGCGGIVAGTDCTAEMVGA